MSITVPTCTPWEPCLYEMITGGPPFKVSGSVADLVTIVRGEIEARRNCVLPAARRAEISLLK